MMTTMTSKLALGFSSALAGDRPDRTGHHGARTAGGRRASRRGPGQRRPQHPARRPERLRRSRATVHEQEVLARVYSRIHWDKMLVGSTLELEVRDDGTAFLRGAVPTKASKERAVVLARDTVGVNKVVNELTILPPPRVIRRPSGDHGTGPRGDHQQALTYAITQPDRCGPSSLRLGGTAARCVPTRAGVAESGSCPSENLVHSTRSVGRRSVGPSTAGGKPGMDHPFSDLLERSRKPARSSSA